MLKRTFDWRPRFDPRSLRFTIVDNFGTSKPLRSRNRRQWGVYLDQGSEGACTGFGTAHALVVTPRRRKDVSVEVARSIYHLAREHDEWPGEDYEGSSVLGAMKAAETLGFIKAYYWATSLKQMQHAVASDLGAIVFGSNWYEGMNRPDADGFIHASGELEGGHCFSLSGIDLKREAFILHNSWGSDWGGQGGAPKGSAFLSFSDAKRLLGEDGEAALMRKK